MNFYDENSTYELMENYEDEVGDILYLKELYPASLTGLQMIIDDECDKLEYDGSIMFDEYPDKERLRALEKEIFSIAKEEMSKKMEKNQDANGMPADVWLKDFVSILLINEMMRRRSRRRMGRRGFC